SNLDQPLSEALVGRVALGHDDKGLATTGGWRVLPELAAAGLWSTPSDLARFLLGLIRSAQGLPGAVLDQPTIEAMLTPVDGFSYGLGGAVGGAGLGRYFMKRGQNIGYQGWMMAFPAAGQGAAMMTSSDAGNRLFEPLMHRLAAAFAWPAFDQLAD